MFGAITEKRRLVCLRHLEQDHTHQANIGKGALNICQATNHLKPFVQSLLLFLSLRLGLRCRKFLLESGFPGRQHKRQEPLQGEHPRCCFACISDLTFGPFRTSEQPPAYETSLSQPAMMLHRSESDSTLAEPARPTPSIAFSAPPVPAYQRAGQ